MEQNKDKEYEKFPLIIYSLTIYFFVLGATHTLGRWALFPINIFDFMGVVDIAKSAAPNVALVLIFLVIQSIFLHLTNKNELNLIVEQSSYIEGLLKKVSAILIWAIMVVAFISFTGLIYIVSKGPKLLSEYGNISMFVIATPMLLILIMAYVIIVNESVKRTSVWKYYAMALCTLALAPFFSFMIGFVGAIKIIDGKRFNYIVSGVENGEDDIVSRDRYLGYYGDKYFVWSPKDELVKILPNSQDLKIKQYNKNQ